MYSDLTKYTVSINDSLTEVLKKINDLPDVLTVFVTDTNQKVLGTITDGDIRRGLIHGLGMSNAIEQFMFTSFSFLIVGENNFEKLKTFRKKRLKVVPLLDTKGRLVKIYNFTEIKSILPIDAVLMAGGEGIRLRPLTENTPKPLLKIGTKEIIAYNIDRLYQFGITKQHITVNYLADQIVSYCQSYPNPTVQFDLIHEKELKGTAGALSLIEHFENEHVLLMNSDLLTNVNYEDLYITFVESKADMLVVSTPYEVNLPYAIFDTNDTEVLSFKEKPSYRYFANAGIYLFKKELISLIPKDRMYHATDFMNDIIDSGKKLIHFPIRGYWLDIGKHNDFEKAQKDVLHINWE